AAGWSGPAAAEAVECGDRVPGAALAGTSGAMLSRPSRDAFGLPGLCGPRKHAVGDGMLSRPGKPRRTDPDLRGPRKHGTQHPPNEAVDRPPSYRGGGAARRPGDGLLRAGA